MVQRISTSNITGITETLCGVFFSKSTISPPCAGPNPLVHAFNERRLMAFYPFVLVDALVLTVR